MIDKRGSAEPREQSAEAARTVAELAARGAWGAAYRQIALIDDWSVIDGQGIETLATAAYMTGHEDEFVEILDRAFNAFCGEARQMRAARAAFWIGLTLMFRGEKGRAGGWLSRCVGLVDDHGTADCAERGYVLLPRVEAAFAAGDLDTAQYLAGQAQRIGERSADTDLTEMARHLLGRGRMASGAVPEGLALLDETMLAVNERKLSPIVTGLIYCSVIEACRRYQILSRGREWTEALTDWCAGQTELVAFTGRCQIHRSEILLLDGKWTEAAEAARAACQKLMTGPLEHQAGPAHYQLGEVLRLSGRFDAADECYRTAVRLGFNPQPGLALMSLRQGNMTSASAAIRRSLAAVETSTARLGLLPAAIEIALAVGARDAAEEYCGELAGLCRQYPSDATEAAATEARGDLQKAGKEIDAALQCYGKAAVFWRTLRAPYQLARVRLKTGRACEELGDRDGARTEAEAARDAFASLGAAPDRHDADRLLRILVPHPRSLLTPRQSEVLRFVALGLTNRQIAARLNLSERTIDRHVSDILTRIDLPTRAAAASFAVAHGLVDGTELGRSTHPE